MSSPLKFNEFYADIRSHFSGNSWDYDKFKQSGGIPGKVEYLMGHTIVKKSLANLASKNSQIPLCSIFGPPSKSREEKSSVSEILMPENLVQGTTNPKYPQMSKKIEVKVNKKKGRMLVAKEKIEPGENFLFFFLHSKSLKLSMSALIKQMYRSRQ